ncbi:hypothetical protein ACFWIQ_32565 [Kitasatospora sp. NPDC127059]|uniref:hypothetical protein n=1 Tax=unclassified Kitasatospora TaxID=2633591 RepID=UPI003653D2D0
MLGPTGGSGHLGAAFTGLARVRDVDAARAFLAADPERLSFVQYPCAAVEDVARILTVLRVRFPLLRGQHPDQWCYRASDRRHALLAVARSSDLLLVSDGDAEVPSTGAVPVVTYTGLHVLSPERIASAATIGLVSPLRTGAGDRRDATDEVIAALGGLGPLSVVRYSVLTRVATDVLTRLPSVPAKPSAGATAPRTTSS